MYKITLWDKNIPSCCSGTFFFFVEDLEQFESKWLRTESNVHTIDRYYRSKHGELVTDFYPTDHDEELNIVQEDKFAEVKQEKCYTYTNKKLTLRNGCDYPSEFIFDELKVTVRVIQYKNEYWLAGQYEINGGVQLDELGYNRWKDEKIKYSQMGFYGNSIAEYRKREPNWDKIYTESGFPVDDAYADFYTNDRSFFKYEHIHSFVWLPIEQVDISYKVKKLTNKQLQILLRDIVGDAG